MSASGFTIDRLDHVVFPVSFRDPDGNLIEISTYAHQMLSDVQSSE